ncbi:hypothetical protein OIU76_023356 [Salix suchowensis]|nr:hypothetical protein OIU76_023356 [Salix suchowensis]
MDTHGVEGSVKGKAIEQLNELQKQVGLPPEYAQKVIKTLQLQKWQLLLKLKNNPAPEKLCRLQYLLGISDSAATALGETKDSVFSVGAEEEKFVF